MGTITSWAISIPFCSKLYSPPFSGTGLCNFYFSYLMTSNSTWATCCCCVCCFRGIKAYVTESSSFPGLLFFWKVNILHLTIPGKSHVSLNVMDWLLVRRLIVINSNKITTAFTGLGNLRTLVNKIISLKKHHSLHVFF